MRAVIQRVSHATVEVDKKIVSSIDAGMAVLLAVGRDDTDKDARYLADKIIALRIFDDSNGIMNISLKDMNGSILVVSQFTLYGDCRKGRRPDYTASAPAEQAHKLYEQFIAYLREHTAHVKTGMFGSDMKLTLVNDGPVTLILDTAL